MSDEFKPTTPSQPARQMDELEQKALEKAAEERKKLKMKEEAQQKRAEQMKKAKEGFTKVAGKYPAVIHGGKKVQSKLTGFVEATPWLRDHQAKFTVAMIAVIVMELIKLSQYQGYLGSFILTLLPLILLFFFDFSAKMIEEKKEEKAEDKKAD